ncbi:hypothetical protein [Eisenbergiella tayi]|uniref:hypothetical protein n=2 Tax=Eisenbergiella tayi TaxID=1432052 RepID=UPI00242CED81|nr:hypothetical protein [Eisenbergiella tayi]
MKVQNNIVLNSDLNNGNLSLDYTDGTLWWNVKVGADTVRKKCSGGPQLIMHRYDGLLTASISIFEVIGLSSITFSVTRPAYGAFGIYGQNAPAAGYQNGTLISQTPGTLNENTIMVDVFDWDYINISTAGRSGYYDDYAIVNYS